VPVVALLMGGQPIVSFTRSVTSSGLIALVAVMVGPVAAHIVDTRRVTGAFRNR